MVAAAGGAQSLHVRKAVGQAGVERDKLNGAAGVGTDSAGCQDADCDVDHDRAGMEQVERPHIHGAAGQVHSTRSTGDDDAGLRGNASRHDDICITGAALACGVWRPV